MEIKLRKATLEDANLLLHWRNDPSARRQFGNSNEVTWDEHVQWLKLTLQEKISDRILTIAEVADGRAVGTVRGDLKENGYYDLSYTVAPEWRGQGIGVAMATRFVSEYLSGKKVQCRVNEGNVASEKIAHALGFAPVSKTEKPGYPALVLWQ
ncbi:MAG: GNAT family N-acetyltransferase [Limisphaerales bacterium]